MLAPDQSQLPEETRESVSRSMSDYNLYSVRRVDSVNSRSEYVVNSAFPSPEQNYERDCYRQQRFP